MTPRKHQNALSKHAKIELQAARVLKDRDITSPPIPVRKLAEDLGIHVRFQPFVGESDVSAVLKRDGTKVVIGVNSSHPITRQRFSIAHELGHYHLHKEEQLFIDFSSMMTKQHSMRYRNTVSGQATNREEVEANTFAAALLMPKGMVRRELTALLDADPDLSAENATAELARKFHVSRDAMHYRLLNLGLLVTLG